MKSFYQIPNKELNSFSYMLFVMCNIWTITIAIIVSIGFIYFPDNWPRWVTFLATSIFISLSINYLNQKNKTKLASWLFIIFIWLFIYIPCLTSGGIKAPGIITQVCIIMTAGFLLDWKGGVGFGVLTIVADFLLVYLELNNLLPAEKVHHTSVSRWIGAIIPFGTIISIQYYATNHLRTSIKSMQHEIKLRKELEDEKNKTLYNLNERVKELMCLYEVNLLLQEDDKQKKSTFKKIVDILPSAWQYPEYCAAKITIGSTSFKTENYTESNFKMFSELKSNNNVDIIIEVIYTKEFIEIDEGPFLKEERKLINGLTQILKSYIDRCEYHQQLNNYKYAIENSTILSITDNQNRYSYINENFTAISKYDESELIGKDWNIVTSGIHDSDFFENIAEELKTKKHIRREFCNKSKDGNIYWIESTIVPFYDDDNNLIEILSISNDITDRKINEEKIKESEKKLRKITSQVPSNTYMFTIDDEGNTNFLFMNKGSDNLNHKHTLDQLKSNPSLLIAKIYEPDREIFKNSLINAQKKMEQIDVKYRMYIDNQIRWRWMQAVPEKNNNGEIIWYGASTDITILVDHITSIQQFNFDISHVLRRPIATMLGLTSILQEGNLDEKEMQNLLKSIQTISIEMDHVMQNLNQNYSKNNDSNQLNLDVDSLIDKRKELFSN